MDRGIETWAVHASGGWRGGRWAGARRGPGPASEHGRAPCGHPELSPAGSPGYAQPKIKNVFDWWMDDCKTEENKEKNSLHLNTKK